jgi:hypothetical protein
VQIFSVDVSAGGWWILGWRPLGWRINEQALMQWLRRKDWPNASAFDIDAIYGANARECFGWDGHGSLDVIILPKRLIT